MSNPDIACGVYAGRGGSADELKACGMADEDDGRGEDVEAIVGRTMTRAVVGIGVGFEGVGFECGMGVGDNS